MSELNNRQTAEKKDYTELPTNRLIDYIINNYHGYSWMELGKLGKLVTTILRVHGPGNPELYDVHKLFYTLKTELEAQLIKQESLQYDILEAYLSSESKELLVKAINSIDEDKAEHTKTLEIFKEIRNVTNNYTLPGDACPTYESTYEKLKEFEDNLTQHIYYENNVLYPRLRELNK